MVLSHWVGGNGSLIRKAIKVDGREDMCTQPSCLDRTRALNIRDFISIYIHSIQRRESESSTLSVAFSFSRIALYTVLEGSSIFWTFWLEGGEKSRLPPFYSPWNYFVSPIDNMKDLWSQMVISTALRSVKNTLLGSAPWNFSLLCGKVKINIVHVVRNVRRVFTILHLFHLLMWGVRIVVITFPPTAKIGV